MFEFSQSFKTAIRYILRNRFLTAASVFVMTLSLFVFLSFSVSVIVSHFVLSSLEDKAQITVFFKNTASQAALTTVRDEVSQRDDVEEVVYVSQEEALKIYLGQHQDDPTLIESVSSKILPASLEIKAKRLSSLATLVEELKTKPDVDEVVYFKDVVETFGRWTLVLRTVGLSLVLLMLMVSILVVLLAVGISVKIRAEEIEIMRLIGATDRQVTSPFLWQGGLYGFLSSLVSFLVFALGFIFLVPLFKTLTSSLNLADSFRMTLFFLFLLHFVTGPLLGIISAYLGVRKYLRL